MFAPSARNGSARSSSYPYSVRGRRGKPLVSAEQFSPDLRHMHGVVRLRPISVQNDPPKALEISSKHAVEFFPHLRRVDLLAAVVN